MYYIVPDHPLDIVKQTFKIPTRGDFYAERFGKKVWVSLTCPTAVVPLQNLCIDGINVKEYKVSHDLFWNSLSTVHPLMKRLCDENSVFTWTFAGGFPGQNRLCIDDEVVENKDCDFAIRSFEIRAKKTTKYNITIRSELYYDLMKQAGTLMRLRILRATFSVNGLATVVMERTTECISASTFYLDRGVMDVRL